MTKRLGFMFAGQGAQMVGMGRDLAAESPAAAALYEQAGTILGRDLADICFNGPAEALTASTNCQPAIYTTSLACLAAFQEKCGLKPLVCGGLSLGEFAALTAAGGCGFADGLKLVARRGELMQEACRQSEGAMAAVIGAENTLIAGICADNNVDVANYNCPGQTVISGAREKVAAAVQALSDAGVKRVVMLEVDGAFHSRLMSPAAPGLEAALAATDFTDPQESAVVQNFTGGVTVKAADIRTNLLKQLTGSVRWEECLRAMLEMNLDALVEFGPGKALSGFVRRIDRTMPVYSVGSIADLAPLLEFCI